MSFALSRVSLPESLKMKAPLPGPCHPAAQPPHYKDRKQTFHALINRDPSKASFQVDRAMSSPHGRASRLCLQKGTTGPHPHSALHAPYRRKEIRLPIPLPADRPPSRGRTANRALHQRGRFRDIGPTSRKGNGKRRARSTGNHFFFFARLNEKCEGSMCA